MDLAKLVLSQRGGWLLIVVLAALLVLLLFAAVIVILRAVTRGRSLEFWGIKIGEGVKTATGDSKVVTTPTSTESKVSPTKTGHQKILYVKVLHLKQRTEEQQPTYRYRPFPNREEILVYDEAAYYSLHLFGGSEDEFRWSVVTSGSAVPRIVHPWRKEPNFLDPLEAEMWSHVTPISDEQSNVYLAITHMYNGLQPGREEVYAKIEHDTDYVRVVLDMASLAHPKPRFRTRPEGVVIKERGQQIIVSADEVYPWVFTVAQQNLKKGSLLKIRWTLDWAKESTQTDCAHHSS